MPQKGYLVRRRLAYAGTLRVSLTAAAHRVLPQAVDDVERPSYGPFPIRRRSSHRFRSWRGPLHRDMCRGVTSTGQSILSARPIKTI